MKRSALALTRTFASVAVAALLCGGCDRLKAMAGKGGDASAEPSGGGLLSVLDAAFEGEITMAVSGKGAEGGPKTILFGMKSPKYRFDVTGASAGASNPALAQGAAIILDPPAKKAYALVASQKKAFVVDFAKLKGMNVPRPGGGSAPSGAGAPSEPPPKVENTGKKETVAGYACEVWRITSKDGKAELCLAQGITWMDVTELGLKSPELAAAAALHDLNHFPLKVVAFDRAGAETARMEAKKIEKKAIDDARFTVPPDYQLMDMSQMLGGMGAGGAPGVPAGMPPGMPPGFTPPKPRAR